MIVSLRFSLSRLGGKPHCTPLPSGEQQLLTGRATLSQRVDTSPVRLILLYPVLHGRHRPRLVPSRSLQTSLSKPDLCLLRVSVAPGILLLFYILSVQSPSKNILGLLRFALWPLAS